MGLFVAPTARLGATNYSLHTTHYRNSLLSRPQAHPITHYSLLITHFRRPRPLRPRPLRPLPLLPPYLVTNNYYITKYAVL